MSTTIYVTLIALILSGLVISVLHHRLRSISAPPEQPSPVPSELGTFIEVGYVIVDPDKGNVEVHMSKAALLELKEEIEMPRGVELYVHLVGYNPATAASTPTNTNKENMI
jgi:hypothetical protein